MRVKALRNVARIREREASVFEPDGAGKYRLVGRVQIDDLENAKR